MRRVVRCEWRVHSQKSLSLKPEEALWHNVEEKLYNKNLPDDIKLQNNFVGTKQHRLHTDLDRLIILSLLLSFEHNFSRVKPQPLW